MVPLLVRLQFISTEREKMWKWNSLSLSRIAIPSRLERLLLCRLIYTLASNIYAQVQTYYTYALCYIYRIWRTTPAHNLQYGTVNTRMLDYPQTSHLIHFRLKMWAGRFVWSNETETGRLIPCPTQLLCEWIATLLESSKRTIQAESWS